MSGGSETYEYRCREFYGNPTDLRRNSALASGGGYAMWYTVVPALSATSASSVQLSVPAIAALGGVVFLAEPITLRLALASLAILGGIMLVIRAREN